MPPAKDKLRPTVIGPAGAARLPEDAPATARRVPAVTPGGAAADGHPGR